MLLTGGSGFIGSYVALSLLSRKAHVSVMDTHRPRIREVSFYRADVTKSSQIKRAFKDVFCVVHLAGALGVERTERNPVHTLSTNIEGTKVILEECIERGVKRIIFASSSEVYGEPRKLPTSEEDVTAPLSVYGISKLASEEYVKAYSLEYGLEHVILRYFNVYGPRQSTDFVIPRFVRAVLQKKPVPLIGSGSQVRSFVYVDDAAQATANAVFQRKLKREVINIGNDKEPIRIRELGRRIGMVCNVTPRFTTIPIKGTERARREIYRRVPSIEKARRLLMFEPAISLTEGLRNVVDFVKDNWI